MDLEKLVEVGLTRNEAMVYISLLELGETKTGALVKKTGMHRVLIYDALESLIKKGLVSYVIKENIKYFEATDPQRLVDFIKEKEDLANSLLPALMAKKSLSKTKQQVSVYEGIRGLKSALNNMLKELSPNGVHRVFASGNMADKLGINYYKFYQKIKKQNKIATFVVYDESFRAKKDIINLTVGKIRFYKMSHFPTDTWIYNDKVLIVNYMADPPVAILIESKETAESYRNLFEEFWKKANK